MDLTIILLCVAILLLAALIICVIFLLKRKSTPTITSQTVYIERNTELVQTEEADKTDTPNDKALSIAAVSEIMLKNNHGQELALKKPDNLALLNKKYKEICVSGSSVLANVTQGAMPALSQAKTISEITKAAPNGLFTATAPITDLMKYKDGTVGSILARDGIAGHSDVVKNAALNKQTEGNEKEIEALELRQTELLEMTKANSQIVEEVVSFFDTPKEILYLANDETGEQRIFVEE